MTPSKSMAVRLLGGALALSLLSAQVLAHAKVLDTLPKADSTVSSPKMIEVHFDEAVELKLSTIKLATPDGTDIPVMSMTSAKDATTLSIMPNSNLKPGTYKVVWSAVSEDGHKQQGSFSFTVK